MKENVTKKCDKVVTNFRAISIQMKENVTKNCNKMRRILEFKWKENTTYNVTNFRFISIVMEQNCDEKYTNCLSKFEAKQI